MTVQQGLWDTYRRIFAVRAGNIPFVQNLLPLGGTDGMPFGVVNAFDESESIALAARQRFGLTGADFLELLFELRRILLEVGNFAAGPILRISIGSNHDGADGVFLSIIEAPDRGQRLAGSRKQLFLAEVIKKGAFRDARIAPEKVSEQKNGSAQQPHCDHDLESVGFFHREGALRLQCGSAFTDHQHSFKLHGMRPESSSDALPSAMA